ncbi:hypothetical protein BDR07DRAFT_1380297 [Suillus spraguei]|nr:hypothetical protein BDR07DRAFT_1380297 [Suillus spraguei]
MPFDVVFWRSFYGTRLYVHAMHDPTLWGSLLTFKEILSQRWRILSTLTPCTRPEYERTCGGPGAPVRAPDFNSALDARPRNTAQSLANEQHGRLSTAGIGMAKADRHLRSSLPFIALIEAAEFDDDKWPGQRALQRKLAAVQEENPADVHSLVLELDMTVLPIKHRIQPLRQCIGQFQDTNWMRIIQDRQALQGNSILPVMTIITTIEGARRRSLFSPRTALQLAFGWPPSKFTEELPISRNGDESTFNSETVQKDPTPTLAIGAAECLRITATELPALALSGWLAVQSDLSWVLATRSHHGVILDSTSKTARFFCDLRTPFALFRWTHLFLVYLIDNFRIRMNLWCQVPLSTRCDTLEDHGARK